MSAFPARSAAEQLLSGALCEPASLLIYLLVKEITTAVITGLGWVRGEGWGSPAPEEAAVKSPVSGQSSGITALAEGLDRWAGVPLRLWHGARSSSGLRRGRAEERPPPGTQASQAPEGTNGPLQAQNEGDMVAVRAGQELSSQGAPRPPAPQPPLVSWTEKYLVPAGVGPKLCVTRSWENRTRTARGKFCPRGLLAMSGGPSGCCCVAAVGLVLTFSGSGPGMLPTVLQ